MRTTITWMSLALALAACGPQPSAPSVTPAPTTPKPECRSAAYQFGQGGNGLAYLGAGWSPPEKDGTWSDGPAATINLPLPDGAQAASVQITAIPFGESTAMKLWSGNKLISSGLLTKDKTTVGFTATMTREVSLTLMFPSAKSPKALGQSDDVRQLGLRLQTIRVAPKCADELK